MLKLLFRGATVVAVVVASIFTRNLVKKLAGKHVAILGRQQVGKTTLLCVLRDGSLLERAKSTVDPVPGGDFKVVVAGKAVAFDVPKDLPGNHDLGFADWKEAFLGADYVWYLFRSDLIAQGDSSEISMVKDHLDMFKDWMPQGRGGRPKIILIGTWADKDPRYERDSGKFKRQVGRANPIKLGAVKLDNAGLVVGSLLTDIEAKKLIESLRRHL